MEEFTWKSPNDGRMRARVQARRRRAVQMDAIRWELTETTRPMVGVLEQARRARRPRVSPKIYALLAVVTLLVFCGLVILPHGRSSGKNNALAAAPNPTATPDTTGMEEVRLLSRIDPPKKPVRILILGSDKRSDDPSFRTDVIMLVTIDGANNQVSAVSFPRDLIATVPSYGDIRMNIIMEKFGFSVMQDTLEQNFGARPDYYFMTNFNGFADLINSIGGIEVNAAQTLEDACDLYWSRGGRCEVEPGVHTFDGAAALWYIRSRHTSSDFDRLRRAQEVMVGIFNRFMTMHAILRLPELYQQYSKDVETSMDVPQMLSLMPVAMQVIRNPARIHRYAINPKEASDMWTTDGQAVLWPDKAAIQQIVKEASFEQ